MADQPSSDEILGAIQASGYLMEQEVASTLEGLALHVQTNRAFEDSAEGKSRELDVAAVQRLHLDEENQVAVFIELLCECKNSRNPFVFLLRPTTPADDHRKIEEILLPREAYHVAVEGKPNTMISVSAVDHLGIRPLHYRSGAQLKAVQFAKVVRDKSTWTANHSGLYDAVFFPLLKALIARRQEVLEFGGDWRYVWMLFPTVVTSGALFTMDTSGSSPVPEPTDHVPYVRHIKSSQIDGYFAVDFVTQEGLERHVQERIMPFANAVAEIVRKTPSQFKRQR